jgi:putative ABC transport system ATP-binding protein
LSAIVRLREVSRTYQLGSRVVPALQGVDLTIDDAGFYAIMGPSGSGKSTLLHLLAALDRLDAGTIEIAGQSFRRRSVGIVFQQFNLIASMTALDNVALPAMLDGMGRAERLARARNLLERLHLGPRTGHRPDALSGGEQQRVAIARALMFDPAVLLADEPTGNLDSRTAAELWALLKELAGERSMTVLMVTHEPVAATYCQRVFLLRDGRITGAFDVDGLDASELATRAQYAGE